MAVIEIKHTTLKVVTFDVTLNVWDKDWAIRVTAQVRPDTPEVPTLIWLDHCSAARAKDPGWVLASPFWEAARQQIETKGPLVDAYKLAVAQPQEIAP